MDLHSILNNLYTRKRKLDEVINNLESLGDSESLHARPVGRRGRKQMPEEERKIVAERMRNYWAARKKKDK